ncbi:MAG: hypothetical protein GY851_03310 [bacterium]|nr:hypothetical protein [bacterium]
MGLDCYAHAVLAVKVSASLLYPLKDVRGCPHEHSSKYCPECGAPHHERKSSHITDEFAEEHTIGGLAVLHNYDADFALIVIRGVETASHRSESEGISGMMYEGFVGKLDEAEAKLSPLGLWDRDTLGIYAFRKDSY